MSQKKLKSLSPLTLLVLLSVAAFGFDCGATTQIGWSSVLAFPLRLIGWVW